MPRRRRREGGRGGAIWIAPVACALVVVFALAVSRPDSGDEPSDASRGETLAGLSEAELESGGMGGGLSERSRDLLDMLEGDDGTTSSRTEFLRDIAGDGDAGGGAVRTVRWDEDGELPAVAEGVLRAYQRLGTAVLISAGYLDIKGNAWAALLRIDGCDVDVVTVRTEDDVVSSVRVSRLMAEGDAG